MEQRSRLIIPNKMRDFVQKLPEDLRKRLSFFDLDRICRIFHDREEALLFERDQARFIAAGIRAEADHVWDGHTSEDVADRIRARLRAF